MQTIESKSTSLDSLPQQQSNEDGQQKLVQEILQEIKDEPQNNMQQYQMDPSVNMSGPAGQMPTQDEIRDMQQMQQMQEQQMQEQQMQEQLLNHTSKSISLADKLMDNSKETILATVLFLLLSQPFLNKALAKIPQALTETGDCSMIGLLLKTVLFAAIFLAIKTLAL